MTIPTLITLLTLTVNPVDGLAPFQPDITLAVDPSLVSGRLCVGAVVDTDTSGGIAHDQWYCRMLPAPDSHIHLTFPFRGVWAVWAQVKGKDKKGKDVVYFTPEITVVVK